MRRDNGVIGSDCPEGGRAGSNEQRHAYCFQRMNTHSNEAHDALIRQEVGVKTANAG